MLASELDSSMGSSSELDLFEGKKLGLSGVGEDFSGKHKASPDRVIGNRIGRATASDSKILVNNVRLDEMRLGSPEDNGDGSTIIEFQHSAIRKASSG